MKLTIEDKLKIYKLKKRGYRYKDIGKQFCIDPSNLSYMCDLIDLYGKEAIDTRHRRKYTKEFKQKLINKVLIDKEKVYNVALQYGLPTYSILQNWITDYKKNNNNIIERPQGMCSHKNINITLGNALITKARTKLLNDINWREVRFTSPQRFIKKNKGKFYYSIRFETFEKRKYEMTYFLNDIQQKNNFKPTRIFDVFLNVVSLKKV